MTNSLENKVATFRKLKEHIEGMKDCLEPMKSRLKQLMDEIFSEFSKKPSLYNILKRKNAASGFIGNELVQFNFATEVVRTDGKDPDDEKWLLAMRATSLGMQYVKIGYKLNKSKIKADYSAKLLTDDDLRDLGVKFDATYNLTVRRLPKASEVEEVKAAAMRLADDAEEAE